MNTTHTKPRIRILGRTDKIGTCDCCGREGLLRTVRMDVDGSQRHYGTGCAARAVGVGIPAIRRAVREAEDAAHAERMRTEQARARVKRAAWEAWYLARAGVAIGSPESFARGDMGALRAEYRAETEAAA